MHHEVTERFCSAGLRLCPTLESMLDEDPTHQTERRGSGFTQATRFLSAHINQSRSLTSPGDLDIFNRRSDAPRTQDALERLDALRDGMTREESRLLTAMLCDILRPRPDSPGTGPQLPVWQDKLSVGSCPMAEKWFLELAHGFVPRTARCNFIVDRYGRPLLLEKIGMGDDHSCLSLQPLVMNGVSIPIGSLLAVKYETGALTNAPANINLPGQQIRLEDCQGFRMLRLTTLSVSGPHRRRAFSTHFDAQVAEGLFEPAKTDIGQLRHLAEGAVAGAQAS